MTSENKAFWLTWHMNSKYFVLVFSYLVDQDSSSSRMNTVAAAYPMAAWQLCFIFPTVGEASGVPQSERPYLWTKIEVSFVNFVVGPGFFNILFLGMFLLLNPVFTACSMPFITSATISEYRCLEHLSSCLQIFLKNQVCN